MKGLWCVIGKACLDETFATDLVGIVQRSYFESREDGSTRSVEENLSDFLFFEHGFMLSRWERGEVIRLITQWAPRLAEIRELCGEKAPPDIASENFYAFIGLSCIDGQLSKQLKAFSENGFNRDLSATMARFRLADGEIRYLRWFFNLAEIFTRLQNAHDDFWTRPTAGETTSCVWSFTYDPDYRHLPPSLLNSLLKEPKDDPKPDFF